MLIPGSPRWLLWQVVDILFPKRSPHIRQGHDPLKTHVSRCSGQCQCGQHSAWHAPRGGVTMTRGSFHSTGVWAPVIFYQHCWVPKIKYGHCSGPFTYTKENTGKKAAEVGFEGLKLPPQNTHGILGGVTSLGFPLKLVFLSLLIALVYPGMWAHSRAVRVSEQELQRRTSLVPFSWEYSVCIYGSFCAASVADIYTHVFSLCLSLWRGGGQCLVLALEGVAFLHFQFFV